ncbi:phytanoyl-CoA dioxygenase family protein [Nocardiopsis sp. EMB25]|uniref:phytanoyl-CoA dioxygenase family protein n=1 Tax=Nocardiopsis sp. EMB25 TaxID=2835867 RepID=UPI00228385BF|nr:phytanoyl-CoA dioxygenase family protein [Nocardiopsis sp. EMB25]MCY9783706.1 phytanoyl-CoA dioxygenase family protein [Nocardiopsis sp. EMB25]
MRTAGPTDEQVERFITDGFLHLEEAFPRELADEARAIMWEATGKDPDDPTTWDEPVVRLNTFAQQPFYLAANTDRLHAAFDRLVGPGRWQEVMGLGTFPVRFPHPEAPGDDGWHIDAGWHPELVRMAGREHEIDWASFDWGGFRTNLRSRGRALLMLFLFSDVEADDAPTRIRVGSHLDVPRSLEPLGEEGGNVTGAEESAHRPIALATGRAGDVYLCHPFLVHGAQPHRGTRPRFMGQPPLVPSTGMRLERPHGRYSPVEIAILRGLGRDPGLAPWEAA